MIWNPQMETIDRQSLEKLQLERLQNTVKWVYERVPMYRQRLDERNIRPQDIQSLRDIARLPFTVKDDLRDHYPYGLFAVPMRDVVRIHAPPAPPAGPRWWATPGRTWTCGPRPWPA